MSCIYNKHINFLIYNNNPIITCFTLATKNSTIGRSIDFIAFLISLTRKVEPFCGSASSTILTYSMLLLIMVSSSSYINVLSDGSSIVL